MAVTQRAIDYYKQVTDVMILKIFSLKNLAIKSIGVFDSNQS
jgi:hypothetical protein